MKMLEALQLRREPVFQRMLERMRAACATRFNLRMNIARQVVGAAYRVSFFLPKGAVEGNSTPVFASCRVYSYGEVVRIQWRNDYPQEIWPVPAIDLKAWLIEELHREVPHTPTAAVFLLGDT